MLCANLPFHFDIYVDIVGICGNILRICCDSTAVFVSSFGPFMTHVEQGLRCKDDIGCSETYEAPPVQHSNARATSHLYTQKHNFVQTVFLLGHAKRNTVL